MNGLTAVLLLFGVTIMLGLVGLAIAWLLAPSRPHPRKVQRYEAGNPPEGPGRGSLEMQYYGFLIAFLVAEPIVIFLYTLTPVLGPGSLPLVVAVFALLAPPLAYAVKLARRVELWRF